LARSGRGPSGSGRRRAGWPSLLAQSTAGNRSVGPHTYTPTRLARWSGRSGRSRMEPAASLARWIGSSFLAIRAHRSQPDTLGLRSASACSCRSTRPSSTGWFGPAHSPAMGGGRSLPRTLRIETSRRSDVPIRGTSESSTPRGEAGSRPRSASCRTLSRTPRTFASRPCGVIDSNKNDSRSAYLPARPCCIPRMLPCTNYTAWRGGVP
jgi:hypothetical protein